MTPRAAEAGFTLIESLVAFAVIAAMASLLFEAVGIHAHAVQRVEQKRVAIMLARSLLAQAAVPPGPGEPGDTGRSGDLTWRLSRRAVAQTAREEGVPLEEIRIDIADGASGRPMARVSTLRLAR